MNEQYTADGLLAYARRRGWQVVVFEERGQVGVTVRGPAIPGSQPRSPMRMADQWYIQAVYERREEVGALLAAEAILAKPC